MARSPRSISPSAGCPPFQRLPTTKAISKHYLAASTSAPKLTTSSAPSTLPSTVNFRKCPGSTSLFPRFSIPRSPPAATPPAKLSATADDFLLPCGGVASLHPLQLRRVINDRHRSHQTENPATTGRIPLPRRPSQIRRPLHPRSVLTPRRRPKSSLTLSPAVPRKASPSCSPPKFPFGSARL